MIVMKRDLRLHGLTSDHHHALVLARRLEEAAARGGLDVDLSAEIRDRYDEDLGPHFAIDEEELLPARALAGRSDLVDRTLRDHGALRDHLAAAESGDFRDSASSARCSRRMFASRNATSSPRARPVWVQRSSNGSLFARRRGEAPATRSGSCPPCSEMTLLPGTAVFVGRGRGGTGLQSSRLETKGGFVDHRWRSAPQCPGLRPVVLTEGNARVRREPDDSQLGDGLGVGQEALRLA